MQKKPGFVLPVQAIACFVVFFGLALSSNVTAQDSCAEAAAIGLETISGSTRGAPRSGDSDCGRSDNSASNWFRFTAETDSRVLVTTCGSDFDTVLSVYSGCPGDEDNELSCNDDACEAGSRQSEVEFDASAGTEYLVRLAGYRGATGDYTLELGSKGAGPGPEPEPVTCEDAQEIDITDTVEGSTSGLKSTGSASCGSSHWPGARHQQARAVVACIDAITLLSRTDGKLISECDPACFS